MSLIKFNPVRDLLNVEREFNRILGEFNNRFGLGTRQNDEDYENAVWMPLSDVTETVENYQIKFDLPGLTKEDVKISYADGQLIVSGERKYEKETKEAKFHRIERTFGKFYRAFDLPQKIKEDKISAEFKNGELNITIPKAEEAKPKEISIKVN